MLKRGCEKTNHSFFTPPLFLDKQDAQRARAAMRGDGAAGQGVMHLPAAGQLIHQLRQLSNHLRRDFPGLGDKHMLRPDFSALQHFRHILPVHGFHLAPVLFENFQLPFMHFQGGL